MKMLFGVLVGFFAGALVVYLLSNRATNEQVTPDPVRTETQQATPTVEPSGESPSPAPATTPEPTDSDLPDSDAPAGLGHPGPPEGARPATLRRLADGDSFDITWSDTGEQDEVRLFGINAPEGDACFGQEARSVLDVLIGGDELLIESIERDDFFRVLGNVWVGDIFINATMVELGAAITLSDGGQHARVIADAQDRAESAGAGLWSPDSCGPPAEAALRIVWIESDAPGRDDQNKNGEWIKIANDGAIPVDMTDWSIRDESTRHRYLFPTGFTLEAGAEVRVFSGCGDDDVDELYWCDADPVWNNGGDTGFLVDADGRFVDTRSY